MASYAKLMLPLLLALLLVHAAYSQSSSLPSCGSFSIEFYGTHTNESGTCYWSGGSLNLTVGSGMPGYARVEIIGQNGTIYYNKGTTDWCPTYTAELNLTAQDYNITLYSGNGGGFCSSDGNFTVAEFSSKRANLTVTSAPSTIVPSSPVSTAPITSVPTTVTIPASGNSATGLASSQGNTSSSTQGSNSTFYMAMGVVYLIIIISMFIKRHSSRRNTVISNTQSSSTSLQSQLAQNANYQRLAARNPSLAKLVQSNPRLAAQVMSGRAFRTNTGRVIKYYSEPTDTYDGM